MKTYMLIFNLILLPFLIISLNNAYGSNYACCADKNEKCLNIKNYDTKYYCKIKAEGIYVWTDKDPKNKLSKQCMSGSPVFSGPARGGH